MTATYPMPLTGKGQVFGVGVDHYRVGVVGEYLGIDEAVIDNATVGFVADDKDLRAVFGLFGEQ